MTGELVGLASLIAVNAGINIGIYKYFNARIETVYDRIDEEKVKADGKFVGKEVCSIMHESTAKNLAGVETRIEKRLDKFEEQILRRLESFDEKLTKLLAREVK